jgi:RNA polymerase sigma factor (sigma-70 family)
MNFTPADIRILVRAATRRTGVPVRDEDLEQDAALHAVEAFRRVRDVRQPRALLTKVVSDTVHDYWRRRRPFADLAEVDECQMARPPAFEDDLDRSRQLAILRQALKALDTGKRATIEMYYVEGRSIGEIASLRKKSASAVKMELMRARRVLSGIVFDLSKKKSR